ncbi:hypothetical protein C8F04DRAFT_1239845 [Mycena alexandri]|uniref:Uncharacterized protein n=1 Tax=Mycena alexandri TaxID=1745969 RepID=A0AAD6SB88_9AGAR|nr:hypothetical protein C8F04DRAFT_1239845 [Mycena alexandri]
MTGFRLSITLRSCLIQASSSLHRFLRPIVGALPTTGKYLVIVLFLLNAGSWPLVWPFRVISSLFHARIALRMVKMRHLLFKETREKALETWYEDRMPISEHPFRRMWRFTSWVTNFLSTREIVVLSAAQTWTMAILICNMSDSSYAKALDSARFRLALATFEASPTYSAAATGSPSPRRTSIFIREIPVLSRYEVQASIGAWDEKWIWVNRALRQTNPAPPKNSRGSNPTPLNRVMTCSQRARERRPAAAANALLSRAARDAEGDAGSSASPRSASSTEASPSRPRSSSRAMGSTPPPTRATVLAEERAHKLTEDIPRLRRTVRASPPPYYATVPALAPFHRGGWREVR